jgi:hypothetical protein
MDDITNHQISNLVSRNDRGGGKGSQETMYQIKCEKGKRGKGKDKGCWVNGEVKGFWSVAGSFASHVFCITYLGGPRTSHQHLRLG